MLNLLLAPLLEKDCAVCKDQFSLKTEDPDEQVIIELPCKHPFHSPCILPWLKQNGTCPSCRYQLVPQPGSTPNPNETPGPGPSTATSNQPQPTASTNPFVQPRANASSRWSVPSRDRDRRENSESGDSGGFLGMVGNLLHSLAGGNPSPGPAPPSSGTGSGSLPGSWESEPGSRPSHSRSQSTHTAHGMYSNPGSTRPQTSSYGRQSPTFGSSHNTSSSNRDRTGDSASERASRTYRSLRRGGHDRERERNGDRNSQRRNTRPWDHSELD